MALRAWLKKEEVFDVDIEKCLSECMVEGENSFLAMTKEEFDEFDRQVTVARAKDLKDQAAQARAEKKLQKLRNLWKKGNGEDVSAKVAAKGVASDDEKGQGGHGGNVSAQANNEALAKARGLKAWMQKEEIWQTDLFGVLVGKGVRGGDNISGEFKECIGTRSEFNEVIRAVRVLKAEELKDQKSKARLEKLLTKFEKRWETMTDNRKTNIQKGSKADQGQKKADPKEEKINAMGKDGKALKGWMQKQSCWQKDLYESMMEAGYSDPDNVKNMTEKEFDEIIRKVRVAKAEELKDQKSKARVEKLLSKFEKEYRTASGNKKTTIKKGSKAAKGGKKEKSPTDEKVDEMAGAGKELKGYMQKSSFWQLDLYNELLAASITSAEALAKVKVKQFDEIVRKVRVQRAQELKDPGAKKRLEKVLTAFEKEWHKQSGYKKTTIKKGSKVAKGGKKEKAPKDKKNDEMATKGKGLKTWMKKEDIWNKDLYDQLLASNINGLEDLQKIDQKKMDEIIRKVRVEKVATLKDANGRKRVDKLLVSFEKKWKATQA